MTRRRLLKQVAGGTLAALAGKPLSTMWWDGGSVWGAEPGRGVSVGEGLPNEDLVGYVNRVAGKFDLAVFKQVLGAANEFKEGDQITGVAAAADASRRKARELLARTRVGDLLAHPLHSDDLFAFLNDSLDLATATKVAKLTLGELKQFLLTQDEAAIKALMPGLASDVIGCVVKLMSNAELTAVGAKIFNTLPGSRIGAKGYLGARIQPNSPTDNVDDIRWQVLDGFAYAVGDVLLGTNPVSSNPASVHAVEAALQEVLATFGLQETLPHCVLAHIDVQAEVEAKWPGSTTLWFQSIAGSDSANATFDLSLEKMKKHAAARTGKYGLYFETGQGADFTNGHGHGYDMVLHESRKYGFARALTRLVAEAQAKSGSGHQPWVHVNDVAGFIGPEVFRSREQLVRCCLEDIVMGKLHGLCIGLDVCSTLHMEVSLDDLDWCLEAVAPANPAYLMALPTKIDPMLGYLTTGYQDHVRLREKFGYRVNDPMWKFFQSLEVIDASGQPTTHFGDPVWVYLKYRRKKGDARPDEAILAEGRRQLAEVRARGVFVASGFGSRSSELEAKTDRDIRRIYADAKESLWTELTPDFIRLVPEAVPLTTPSVHRTDYILHPESGEKLSDASVRVLEQLRQKQAGRFDVQIVVSDGLNALAITDTGHIEPFLARVCEQLKKHGYQAAPETIVMTSGRVRAGYRIGEKLFYNLKDRRTLMHLIGERPGTGHHTFSVYLTAADGSTWSTPGKIDHNLTKVVSGIATTALLPITAADETVRILIGG